jgi:MYXO-CTERM domain-containing protein
MEGGMGGSAGTGADMLPPLVTAGSVNDGSGGSASGGSGGKKPLVLQSGLDGSPGCACRVGARSSSSAPGWLALAALGVVSLRRRRR